MKDAEGLPISLADVALPVPVARAFTYAVPRDLVDQVRPGVRVICPFGSRRMVGVVLGTRLALPPPRVKAILDVLDREPAIPPDLLAFASDVAQYYFAPIGEVVRLALPPVESKTARALGEPSLFGTPTRGVGARTVQWVVPIAHDSSGTKMGAQAAQILAHLRAVGELPVPRLLDLWRNARAAVKRLVELGLVKIELREQARAPFFTETEPRDVPPTPTVAQAQAIRQIEDALASQSAATFLLHGVTGSGKTEVYLRAIARMRAARRGTIVLVPEIALTPQLVARYRARFGNDVAVLHSGLTAKERYGMWRRLHDGEVEVAMGARSALFAPVRSLGLIIVDEEHDPSFKQEEGVRYHARDMAILRAFRASAVCVLGSATPSLETEWLTRTGKATKLRLPDRARAQAMPPVELVDLRRIGAGPTGDKRISLPLHRAIEETLATRAQTILFLNRRGFAPSVRCAACGDLVACPSCSVALTFHKRAGSVLRCHYCGYEHALPASCAKCGTKNLVLEGLGTERLEETLGTAFPSARIARLDRDVASGKSVEKVLGRMRAREIDILVGTQMVAKGHDLPHVTLVGVINADAALSIPDFRAAERAFQLFVQVAGRAGRGDSPGRVLVQTYNPSHPSVVFASSHDVGGFVERELTDRKELGYPPFTRVALVRTDAVAEAQARHACEALARVAHDAASRAEVRVDVLGPAPAPLARLRNRFRYRLMLRSADRKALRAVLGEVDAARTSLARSVRCSIDVDPVQLL
jgi:primosomal protein N' (replication factor Y)